LFVVVAVAAVVQFVKPVDNLPVAMIDPRRPFPRGFLPLAHEQASRPGVLELEEAIGFCLRVADRQIAGVIAEEVVFPGDPVGLDDGGVEGAAQRRQMRPLAKKRQNILSLLQDRSRGQ
jgi:hypothetical protein